MRRTLEQLIRYVFFLELGIYTVTHNRTWEREERDKREKQGVRNRAENHRER